MNRVGINGHLTAAVLHLIVYGLQLALRSLSSGLVGRARQSNIKSVGLIIELSHLTAETVDEGEDDDSVLIRHAHVVADEVQEEGRRDVEVVIAHLKWVEAIVWTASLRPDLLGQVKGRRGIFVVLEERKCMSKVT